MTDGFYIGDIHVVLYIVTLIMIPIINISNIVDNIDFYPCLFSYVLIALLHACNQKVII